MNSARAGAGQRMCMQEVGTRDSLQVGAASKIEATAGRR